MYGIRMKKTSFAGLVFLMMPLSVLAGVDCTGLAQWARLDNGLQVNQKHVFCGEWKSDHPKGFHSRPGGFNPPTVSNFAMQDRPNAAGIYTGKWSYRNYPGRSKFSTMFPDRCSTAQILKSISHASANPELNCPAGSPGWVKCGKNRPDSDSKEMLSDYCTNNGEFFLIGFAPGRDNRINTAFPIRQ
jgi:Bacterial EndoU nuclease